MINIVLTEEEYEVLLLDLYDYYDEYGSNGDNDDGVFTGEAFLDKLKAAGGEDYAQWNRKDACLSKEFPPENPTWKSPRTRRKVNP